MAKSKMRAYPIPVKDFQFGKGQYNKKLQRKTKIVSSLPMNYNYKVITTQIFRQGARRNLNSGHVIL